MGMYCHKMNLHEQFDKKDSNPASAAGNNTVDTTGAVTCTN